MKIGFSGVGNMSSAIINGLLKQNISAISSLHAFSPSGPKADVPMHGSLQWHTSNLQLAQAVDVLVLGVKPRMIQIVTSEIRELSSLPLIVSLAAGVTTKTIQNQLAPQPATPAIVRTMPNTPSAVGEGMTGLFADKHVSESHKTLMDTIFSSIGKVLWLDTEHKFHGLTAISGSGPAYYFQFTNALIQAGMAQGLTKDEATALAVQTAKGAGLLMAGTGKAPSQLQAEVTSKGGTTSAATTVFHDSGIDALTHAAVAAAHDRSIEMSQES